MRLNRYPINGNTSINGPTGPVRLVSMSGTITPSSTLQLQANLTLSGTITPAATVQLQANLTLSGTITPSGDLLWTYLRTFTGTITPAGTITLRRLAGVLWTTLLADLRRIIDDAGAEIHSDATLYRWLQHAELFLVIHRYLVEDTQPLSLSASTPIYTIHSAMTDFIMPLRMDISGTSLLRSNFSSLTQLDKDWYTTTGTPERWYGIGTTLLGFHPVPTASTSVNLTFLRVPPDRDADPNIKPLIPDEWQEWLLEWAAGIAKAIEGDLQRATEHMQRAVELAGIAKDWRFGAGASVKPSEDIVESPLAEPED